MRKKKKKGPPIAQESASTIFDHDRSLSPIEQIDASRIANAIANVRQSRPRNMIDDDDDEIALIRGGSRGPRDDALTSPSRAVNGSPEAALRSPSASILQQGNGDAFRAQRPCVLATLPEVKEETEEEKRSKYGHIIVVTIEMVFDPRVQIYDGMRAQVVQYEQPIDFKMRQVMLAFSFRCMAMRLTPEFSPCLVFTRAERKLFRDVRCCQQGEGKYAETGVTQTQG